MYSCHIMAWCVKWLCSVVRSWPHRSPEFDEEASGSSCWTCWTRAANWNSVWAGRSDGEGRTLCWWRDNPQNSGTTRQVEWSKGDCNFLVNILQIYVIEAHASPLVCALCWVVWRNFHSQQHTYMSTEQFLQVQQIGFVTLGPLRHAQSINPGWCLCHCYHDKVIAEFIQLIWWTQNRSNQLLTSNIKSTNLDHETAYSLLLSKPSSIQKWSCYMSRDMITECVLVPVDKGCSSARNRWQQWSSFQPACPPAASEYAPSGCVAPTEWTYDRLPATSRQWVRSSFAKTKLLANRLARIRF